jgi:hypothetical protein
MDQASVGRTHDDKLFLATIVLEAWLRERRPADAKVMLPNERALGAPA